MNPFTITFGLEPLNLIDRRNETEEIIETFTSNYPSTNSYFISGVRGTGKTVL